MRNTSAVKTALLAIRKADPQAVGMVGAYAPCAEFVRLAREMGSRGYSSTSPSSAPTLLPKNSGKTVGGS